MPKPIPTARDCLDPLGLGAQGDARHAMEIRFLLQAAGIGEDECSVLQQAVHVEISERLDYIKRREQQPRSGRCRSRPRMDRKDDAALARRRRQKVDRPFQGSRIVGVLGAVQRRDCIAAALKAEALEDLRPLLRARADKEGRVVHHVAHRTNALADAFAAQIRHRRLGRTEEEIARVVGEHAIDLLGHGTIEGA